MVEVRTFDEICGSSGIEQVDWVKVEHQGAEKDALRGMERMAPHIRHFTISCHDFLGTRVGKVQGRGPRVVGGARVHRGDAGRG